MTIRLTREEKRKINKIKRQLGGLYAGQLSEDVRIREDGAKVCTITDDTGTEYEFTLSKRSQ